MANSPYHRCPVCEQALVATGEDISLDTIFSQWAPISFSDRVKSEHRQQSASTQLFTCPHCELEIFLPMIIGNAHFYEELQTSQEGPYYVDTKWEFGEAFDDINAGSAVIEFGCGPGNFLDVIKSKAQKVVGSEYNETALKIARGKGFTILGPEEDMAAHAQKFDAAFSFHVLEHVADPVGFLRSLASVVKPGGKVGLSVPNKNGAIRWVMPCASNMPPHHATRWSAKTLREVAGKVGLRVDRIAFEPLALKDNYYLNYWAENRFPPGAPLRSMFRSVAKKIVPKAVNRLRQLQVKNVPGFKGLAVYVLMTKS